MPLAARIESAVSRSSHRAQQFIGRLFSKRGTPTALDGKDELLAFDNTAFKVKGKWTAEFVISIFSKRDDEIAHKLEEEILALFGISNDAVEWSRFKYFIAIPRQNVIVDLKMVDGKESFTVGPTEYNGIMSSELAFPIDGHTWVHGEATKFEVVPQNGFDQRPNFTTFFAEDRGIGVISDIDDTIKISDVNDRIKLLQHTFLDKHGEPVPGMPELYKTLSHKLDNPTFVYLSASPWQLYPFLHEMITANYPRGQIILRDMSYVELSSFTASLTIGTQEFKEDEMDKLHRWLPNKQFLAIGDSTQRDPEAYGTIYRKYPGWIKRIWIRVVSGVDPDKEAKLNAPERFEAAFQGIPRDAWHLYTDPSELTNLLI